MKKSLLYISVFMVAVFLGYSSMDSQELKITNVDSKNYPKLDVEVSATDDTGREQESRDFITDLKIYDANTLRAIISQKCADVSTRFSLIIQVDKSGSMQQDRASTNTDFVLKPNRRWDAINEAIQQLVLESNLLNETNNEFALMSFAGVSKMEYEFRTDFGSAELKTDLDEFRDVVQFINLTDFDAALLGIRADNRKNAGIGAIEYSQNARYQPIIIILTDGTQSRGTSANIFVDEINAAIRNAEKPPFVYVMTYGEAGEAVLAEIASASGPAGSVGGKTYDNLASEDVKTTFEDIVDDLGDKLRAIPPCSFIIETDCEGGEIYATATIGSDTFTSPVFNYSVDAQYLPKLAFSELTPYFRDASPSNKVTQTITLTAENNDITFSGNPTFSNPDFTIKTNLNGKTILKGASLPVKVEYQPTIKELAYIKDITVDFTSVSTACSQYDFSPVGKFFYAEDISFTKKSNVGVEIQERIGGGVRNYSGEKAWIIDMTFDNQVGGTFASVTTLPIQLNSGDDLKKIDFTFTASDPPNPDSQAEVCYKVAFANLDTVTYCAIIRAEGGGQAEISLAQDATSPFVCYSDTPKDKDASNVIKVKVDNTGSVEMVITKINISGTEFKQVAPILTKVAPKSSDYIYLSFDPNNSPGDYSVNITVESDNTKGNNTATITATLEDHSFTANVSDFGLRCVGEQFSIDIAFNIGGDPTSISAISSSSDITFPNNITDRTGTIQYSVDISSAVENKNYSESITFTNDCGETQVVTITGNISRPDITGSGTLEASQGNPSTETITLTNVYDNPISNLVFTVDGSNPLSSMVSVDVASSDDNALASGTFNLVLDYTFTEQVIGEPLDILITSTTGCVDDKITVYLTSAKALAKYTISRDLSAVVGQTFDVGIGIESVSDYDNFDAGTKVETKITFNSDVIEPVGITMNPSGLGVGFREITVDLPKYGDVIAFIAKNGGVSKLDNTEILVEFDETKAGISFVVEDSTGLFTLKRIESKLEVGDVKANNGDEFSIIIKFPEELLTQLDAETHIKLEGDFTYNASLFSPTGKTKGDDLGAKYDANLEYFVRTIRFYFDLKEPGAGDDPTYTIAKPDDFVMNFIATLGDAPTTTMNLENVKTEGGEVEIPASSIDQGEFVLTDLHTDSDGNYILFFNASENLTPQISPPNDNPINSPTSIDFTVLESGQHKIWVSDLQGNKVADLVSDYFDAGDYKTTVDPKDMPNGSYIIIYETPTQYFTVKMSVLK